MTVFLIIAVAMAAAAVAWVSLPLLWHRRAAEGVQHATANLAVYRDQLAELDADLSSGTLSGAQYQQAKLEIERRVLEETGGEGTPVDGIMRNGRWMAAVLAAAIPFFAASLYWLLGNPEGLSPQRAAGAGGEHQITPEQIEAMVAKLAARLQQNPDDANGWATLARSYAAMQRFPDALAAYEKAAALAQDDAGLLADYADVLATSTGRNLEGKPVELITRALKLDPSQWKALALAGTAAFNRKDYKSAVTYWEKLQQQLPADSEFALSMKSNIAEARQLGGIKSDAAPVSPPSAAATASVRGMVTVSPVLAAKIQPTDTVFIFARAAEGSRQPVVAVRRQARELPAEFTLDDSQAMSAELKLAGLREVVVGARISKSGGAIPQSGDLQGFSQKVKVGATGVAVVIDTVVP